MDSYGDSTSCFYAHCLDCDEHFERSDADNGDSGCSLCGSAKKALHEVDCVWERSCQLCLSGLTTDERRGMFRVVLGGKS